MPLPSSSSANPSVDLRQKDKPFDRIVDGCVWGQILKSLKDAITRRSGSHM